MEQDDQYFKDLLDDPSFRAQLGIDEDAKPEDFSPEQQEDLANHFLKLERREGKFNNTPEPAGDGKREMANNYGYQKKPGFMKFASMAPGPVGMVGKAANVMMNANNRTAVMRAREALGLEKKSDIGGFVKDNGGQVGDVTYGDYRTAPVGFEAEDKIGRTNMTPNEARMRGIMGGTGLRDASPEESQDAVHNFKQKNPEAVKGPLSGVKNLAKNMLGSDDDDEGENIAHGLGLGSQAQNFRLKNDRGPMKDVKGLVVHHTGGEGTPEGVVNTLNDRGLGVQNIMDRDGNIVTIGDETESRSHIRPSEINDLSNDNTIGIEVIAKDDSDLTPAQIEAGKQWINDTIARHPDIGMNVYGHGQVNSHKQSTEGMSIVNAYIADRDAPLQRPAVPTPRPEPESMMAETNSMTKMGLMNPTDSTVSANPERFKDLTDEDRGLMGLTLAGEIDLSKTDLTTEEGRKEAYGILSTMENRAPKYGGIKNAITAPNQYSTWNNDAAANTASANYNARKDLYDNLVKDYTSTPDSNLGFTSYHANYVNPGWSADMEQKTAIGPHTFGILGEYKAPNAVTADNLVGPKTVFNSGATSAAASMTGGPKGLMSSEGVRSTMSSQPSTAEPKAKDMGTSGMSKSGESKTTGMSSGFSSKSAGMSTGMAKTPSTTSTKGFSSPASSVGRQNYKSVSVEKDKTKEKSQSAGAKSRSDGWS